MPAEKAVLLAHTLTPAPIDRTKAKLAKITGDPYALAKLIALPRNVYLMNSTIVTNFSIDYFNLSIMPNVARMESKGNKVRLTSASSGVTVTVPAFVAEVLRYQDSTDAERALRKVCEDHAISYFRASRKLLNLMDKLVRSEIVYLIECPVPHWER